MEGCTFQAHYKIILKHQSNDHFNLQALAPKLIRLDTPEDIAKWREARRKHYPTLAKKELRAVNGDKSNEDQGQIMAVRNQRGNKHHRNQPYNRYHNNKRHHTGTPREKSDDQKSGLEPVSHAALVPADEPEQGAHQQQQTASIEKEDGEVTDEDESSAVDSGTTTVRIANTTEKARNDHDERRNDEEQAKNSVASVAADYSHDSANAGEAQLHKKSPTLTAVSVSVPPTALALAGSATALEQEPQQLRRKNQDNRVRKDKFITTRKQVNKSRPQSTVRQPQKRRNLTLFQKLVLDDVRREESNIVSCIELLHKLDYKL